MLPILYILQHCNTLQSLGGNFPHHALARWGCALTCLQTGGQGAQSLCKLLPDLGCSAVKQDPSSSSSSFSPLPLTLSPSRPAEQQELGMEQHGDATTGVKPQHSVSPGPSHRLNHPQISSVLEGTAQRLAEIPV